MRPALALLVLLLAGCAGQSVPPPRPAPLGVVLCALPSQVAAEPEPVRPTGPQYTQRDVALYIERLHRWGSRGWARLEAAHAWSNDCVERAAVRDRSAAR